MLNTNSTKLMLIEKLKVYFGIELLHKVSIPFLILRISLNPFSDETFVTPLAPFNNSNNIVSGLLLKSTDYPLKKKESSKFYL